MTTYRELAAQLTTLGLLAEDSARVVCEQLAGQGLLDSELAVHQIPAAMAELGAAVEVHTDDVDDLEEAYRAVVEEAAALSGGAVTVSEVQLLQTTDGDELRLSINGRPLSWRVQHEDPEYLDTLTIAEHIDELAPRADGRRHFYQWDGDEDDMMYLVLATPDQIAALEDAAGSTFISLA